MTSRAMIDCQAADEGRLSRYFDHADTGMTAAQTGDERLSFGTDVEELVLPLLVGFLQLTPKFAR